MQALTDPKAASPPYLDYLRPLTTKTALHPTPPSSKYPNPTTAIIDRTNSIMAIERARSSGTQRCFITKSASFAVELTVYVRTYNGGLGIEEPGVRVTSSWGLKRIG